MEERRTYGFGSVSRRKISKVLSSSQKATDRRNVADLDREVEKGSGNVLFATAESLG